MILSLPHWKARILFVFLAFCLIDSEAVNLGQCFNDVVSCASNSSSPECVSSINISDTDALSILRTSKGSPASSANATALTYVGCVEHCGSEQEPFDWTVFSQEYAAWLLPYLALLSQLPFGAQRRTDNLMSAILTLGSPTLAGYSIYLTLLNARWINDRLFSGIDYPSATVRRSVVQVLINLQQVPLRVHPGRSARFESLVVHPDNDDWWMTLSDELNYSNTWSIASAISIAWVVIAYLLTVTDSLSNVANHINSNGQGTGSVWLWLLPIVVGWLVLSPKCDYIRVRDAYIRTNRQVFVADHANADRIQVSSNFGLTILPDPDWESRTSITSPDELRIPPVFNYARALSWSRTVYVTSLYYRTAWRQWIRRVGVDGKPIPISANASNDIPRESRLGTRDQIVRYCRPDEYPGPDILWPRGIFFNMIIASLMSLQLQWGTTGAAILVAWFTPTIGFGCRSLAYLTYGTLSTIVWILLVWSNLLGDYARHLIDGQRTSPALCKHSPSIPASSIHSSGVSEGLGIVAIPLQEVAVSNVGGEERGDAEPCARTYPIQCPPAYGQTLASFANWLRWIGKLIAVVNAIGIVANSIFQYASVYDNCYCNSSVFTWGASAFNIITPISSDIGLAGKAWIGGLALALICCTFFVGTIYLLTDSLPA